MLPVYWVSARSIVAIQGLPSLLVRVLLCIDTSRVEEGHLGAFDICRKIILVLVRRWLRVWFDLGGKLRTSPGTVGPSPMALSIGATSQYKPVLVRKPSVFPVSNVDSDAHLPWEGLDTLSGRFVHDDGDRDT